MELPIPDLSPDRTSGSIPVPEPGRLTEKLIQIGQPGMKALRGVATGRMPQLRFPSISLEAAKGAMDIERRLTS